MATQTLYRKPVRLGVSGQDTGGRGTVLRAKRELLNYGLQRVRGLRRMAANPLSPCFRAKLVCYMSCVLPFKDPYLLDHPCITAALCYQRMRRSFFSMHFWASALASVANIYTQPWNTLISASNRFVPTSSLYLSAHQLIMSGSHDELHPSDQGPSIVIESFSSPPDSTGPAATDAPSCQTYDASRLFAPDESTTGTQPNSLVLAFQRATGIFQRACSEDSIEHVQSQVPVSPGL